MSIRFNLSKGIKTSALSMVLPLILMAEVHANAESVHDIIDVCTSSERIMKDYALIGMKINYGDPQKDLDTTIKHMDEEMEDLEKQKVIQTLHDEEEALHKEWAKIEEELKKPIAKENALTLRHNINAFSQHCEVLAEHLAKDTGNPAEHYVVLVARMNLDVQKLAGTYVMKGWGAIEDDEYYKEVAQILADVHKAYDELHAADGKLVSDKVKGRLETMKKDFMVFELMAESKSGRSVPLLIAKKADEINAETMEILKEEESEVEK